MAWKKLIALLLTFAVIAAACGSDPDDATDDDAASTDSSDDVASGDDADDDDAASTDSSDDVASGDDTVVDPIFEPIGGICNPATEVAAIYDFVQACRTGGLINPDACLSGTLLPPEGELDLETAGVGPIELTVPVHPDDPDEYLGPMYRPGLLIGPPLTDDVTAELDENNRLNVSVAVGGLVAVAPGPVLGLELELLDLSETSVVVGVDELPTDSGAINALFSVWSIVSAETPELLDPVNVQFVLPELAPVLILVPSSGGHMYGPEGAATAPPSGQVPDLGQSYSNFDEQIAIIDTSFGKQPDGGDPSLVGHGAFISGIIHEILPNAQLAPVEMGPEGQVLSSALGAALGDVYDQPFLGLDMVQLALILSAFSAAANDYAAFNMSFGTYSCNGDPDSEDPPPFLAEVMSLTGNTIVFAAAGNDDTDSPWWPAAFGESDQRVYSIGSTKVDGTKSDFSNHGEIEFCELGTDVVAETYLDGSANSQVGPSGKVFQWSGTSFATPQALAKRLGVGDDTVLTSC